MSKLPLKGFVLDFQINIPLTIELLLLLLLLFVLLHLIPWTYFKHTLSTRTSTAAAIPKHRRSVQWMVLVAGHWISIKKYLCWKTFVWLTICNSSNKKIVVQKKINHTYFVVVFVSFGWTNDRQQHHKTKKTTDRRLRLYNACITFNIQVLLIIFWMYAGRGGLLTSQTQLNSP